MQFLKKVEEFLGNKYFSFAPFLVAILSVVATPKHLLDDNHEIVLAGNRWLSDKSILYVQSWSSNSPQTLFFGHIYSKYFRGSFLQLVFEVLLVSAIMVLLQTVLKMIFRRSHVVNNALLLMFSAIIYTPHVWQRGINEVKLATLFLLLFLFGYCKWKQSTKSYWLLGATSKNWRYLLLAGIAMSLLINTSFLYIPFLIPALVDFVQTTRKSWNKLVSWGAMLVIPLFLEAWLWISHLSSRSLVTPHIRASIVGLLLHTHNSANLSRQLPLLLVLITLLVIVVSHVDARRLVKHRTLWLGCVGLMLLALLLPYVYVFCALPAFTIMLYTYNKHAQSLLAPRVLATVAGIVIILSLPLRWLDARQSSLDYARAQLAIAYVEQRSADSNVITYYGRGAGIYAESGFTGSTRFADLSVLKYDNDAIDMEGSFRGDAEASTPTFVIYATNDDYKAPATPRLDQYFTKHYEKVADLDGYSILKRK